VLLSIILAAALQASGADITSQWSSYVLGQRWDFGVRRQDAEQSPRWSVFLDDPPLPPRQAIQAAQVELTKLVPNADAWWLHGVRIETMGVQDTWAYIVEFGVERQ
jgi:hypothetical protein